MAYSDNTSTHQPPVDVSLKETSTGCLRGLKSGWKQWTETTIRCVTCTQPTSTPTPPIEINFLWNRGWVRGNIFLMVVCGCTCLCPYCIGLYFLFWALPRTAICFCLSKRHPVRPRNGTRVESPKRSKVRLCSSRWRAEDNLTAQSVDYT